MQMQVNAARDFDSPAWAQKSWIGIDQLGREEAITEQALSAAIDICQNEIEQS